MVLHEQLKQEIAGVYHRAAGSYDQVGIRPASYFGSLLIERLNIPAGARVLDVACGRGALLFPAAQQAGPQGRVIGIDLAPAMVAETAAEIRRRGLAQAEVLLMDGDQPSFPAGSFDYVLCGFALHFLDYPRALPRFRLLLKPGGCLATVGPFIPTEDRENMERWQWLFELTRQVFPPDFTPPASWTAPNRLNSPEIMQAVLREAGFAQITVTSEQMLFYFADEQDWWAWEWSQASRFWLEGMSPEGLAKFKAVAFEKLAAMKGPEGIPMRWGALLAMAQKT